MTTQSVTQNHPHHVTYAPAKFNAAMSNGLGDGFTRKYIIRSLLWSWHKWYTIAQQTLHHVTYAPAIVEHFN